MNSLLYKGYTARIEFSDEDDCFIGYIVGIKDVIDFHGETVKELKNALTLFRKFNVMYTSRSACSCCNCCSSAW